MARLVHPEILTKEDLVEAELNVDYELRLKLSAKGFKTRDSQVDYVMNNTPDTFWS
jgi:hypothetical protein